MPAEALATRPSLAGSPAFPAVTIVGWDRIDDLPHPEDHAQAGLVASYDFSAGALTLRCPSLNFETTTGFDDLPVEEIAIATEKDKLGGWPYWIQGNEQPGCRICGERMRLLIQVDSNDNIPFMFGDAGIGHITQCQDHTDVVAFGWACGSMTQERSLA